MCIRDRDITSMFIGKNPSYPAGDTYPICIGWTSSWFMDDYDISYGIDMRPIDGTDNQVSIILLGPGYDFELYNFMQPLATFILSLIHISPIPTWMPCQKSSKTAGLPPETKP